MDDVRAALERALKLPPPADAAAAADAALEEAVEIRSLLRRNVEELSGMLTVLNGEYLPPAVGGDLLRDGPGVLPTGRNIHALDPYRMPSPAATDRGARVAAAILEQHAAANAGAFPETVSVNLWGLDAIKTKGESVAIVLALVGARVVKEGTGRVVRYELVPLSEMPGGRPRVDVLCNMSGIFRDSFANVVALLDDLFQRAADAPEESAEQNFIKKHATEMRSEGVENAGARLFSNPPGDYGSMVNERVGTGEWEDGRELGRHVGGEERVLVRKRRREGRRATGGAPGASEVDGTRRAGDRQRGVRLDGHSGVLREHRRARRGGERRERGPSGGDDGRERSEAVSSEEGGVLRRRNLRRGRRPARPRGDAPLEYRTKLLNPRWADAMADQGSGGAYEISQRMTALVGWGATSGFAEDWVFDGANERYVRDEAMREKLRKANPQAFRNVLRRMLEAAGRGMWNADEETLAELKQLYAEADDELEGVKTRA